MFPRIQSPAAWTKPKTGDFGTGWIIPITGDTIQGVTTPIQCFLLTYYPSPQMLGVCLMFQGFGIWDYLSGLFMDKYEPPKLKELFPDMAFYWLWMMCITQCVASYFLLSQKSFDYFTANNGKDMSLSGGPMGGWWILVCLAGWSMIIPVKFGLI